MVFLYKRIIGLVLVENGVVCRTRNFQPDYRYISNFIDTTYFDEISFIDVTSSRTALDFQAYSVIVNKLMEDSQLPISIGGGIRTIDDIERHRNIGTDRFIINQSCESSDFFIRNAVQTFGQSSIISSIDHWGDRVYENGNISGVALIERIKQISENCGSEILINSVDRDGTLGGLNLQVLDSLSLFPHLSFILAGGVGRAEHIQIALQRNYVQAVCTSNIYHLTTNTISNWRDIMIREGIGLRTI